MDPFIAEFMGLIKPCPLIDNKKHLIHGTEMTAKNFCVVR